MKILTHYQSTPIRTVLKAVIGLLLGACSSNTLEKQQVELVEKPNIVFIFTDDQQWNTIGSVNNPEVRTPNIDRLAEGAFSFSNAYCFGGNTAAVCIPSRNMVMSGKNFFRFEEDIRNIKAQGGKGRRKHFTNPGWINLPKSMKQAGYETFYREKSGSGNNPVVRSHFDNFADIHQVNALKTGRPAQKIVDEALQFVQADRDSSKPFFMYLGIPAPHDPRWALKEFRDLYNEAELTVPENYLSQHPWNIGSNTVRDECLNKWPRSKADIQRHLKDYYATISAMDHDLGRLIDAIENSELAENTLFVFSSDQGLAMGQHGLLGKQNLYEGTMKVPFLLKGAGVPQGESDAFIYLYDLYPTLCELAGIPVPEGLDGRSFKKVLTGEDYSERKQLMMAYTDTQRSIRDERYKLIRYPRINKIELFDLQADPNEVHNLVDAPEHQERIQQMLADLETKAKAAGDIAPLYYDKYQKAEFEYPTEKLKTPFPAGGLAPLDPSYMAEADQE